METIADLGSEAMFVLLVFGLIWAGRDRKLRRRINRSTKLWLCERRWGTSKDLTRRLQPDAWKKMCEARRFPGLKCTRIRRTPVGVDIGLRFGGSLTLRQVEYRVDQLETGLGLPAGSARLRAAAAASDRAVLSVRLRDPLAGDVLWTPREAPRRLKDPLRVAMTQFGEWVELDVRNRIGIFGASGSGKSCMQRVVGAHVIESVDAQLEVWDLKHGLESQHFAGKATRVTSASEAAGRIDWLLNDEFPRRAKLLKDWGTSSWRESADHPALVVMIDEGNVVIRDLSTKALKRLYTGIEQGRALGVYFVWVTQFPKSTNLPTEVRSQLNIRICLRLETEEETRVVFKDKSKEWAAHDLLPFYALVKSATHRTPTEAKSVFLSEDVFKSVQPPVPVPDNEGQTQDSSGQTVPDVSLDDVPDSLRVWVMSETPVPGAETLSEEPTVVVSIPLGERVLSELQSVGKPMGVREIARALGSNPGSVQRALVQSVTAGFVRKTPDAKYVVAS